MNNIKGLKTQKSMKTKHFQHFLLVLAEPLTMILTARNKTMPLRTMRGGFHGYGIRATPEDRGRHFPRGGGSPLQQSDSIRDPPLHRDSFSLVVIPSTHGSLGPPQLFSIASSPGCRNLYSTCTWKWHLSGK